MPPCLSVSRKCPGPASLSDPLPARPVAPALEVMQGELILAAPLPQVPDLSSGEDPDDAFSRVPYEKGFYFLYYLQVIEGCGAAQIPL